MCIAQRFNRAAPLAERAARVKKWKEWNHLLGAGSKSIHSPAMIGTTKVRVCVLHAEPRSHQLYKWWWWWSILWTSLFFDKEYLAHLSVLFCTAALEYQVLDA